MNRKLVKIDYIYVWKIITRIIHFYNQKKKKKSLHRKGKEAWRARFPPRSAPPRINNTSLLLDYFSSVQCIDEPKICQNRLYIRKSRELFIFITKKKEEKDTSKRIGHVDEAWRAPRSAPSRINNSQVSITSPAFNVSMNRKLVKIDYIYI